MQAKASEVILKEGVTFSSWSVGRCNICYCLSCHGCRLCWWFGFLFQTQPGSWVFLEKSPSNKLTWRMQYAEEHNSEAT